MPDLYQIQSRPLLTLERERQLGRMIQRGSRRALDEMIESNLRLAVSCAQRYRHAPQVDIDDLLAAANAGLVAAARRYDGRRGNRFATYALYRIDRACQEYLLVGRRLMIYVPHNVRLRASIAGARGDAASLAAVHRSPSRAAETVRMTTARLDVPVEDVVVPVEPALERRLALAEAASLTDRLMDALRPRDALVLRLRFGLQTGEPMNLGQIGRRLRISRERVRQLEARALTECSALLSLPGCEWREQARWLMS